MTLELFVDNSKNESNKYSWNDEDIQSFKEMIRKENINCRMDDIFLLSFLRARKFDRERALKLLKSYYSVRERYPDYFQDHNPLAVKEALDMKIYGYLRQTDQEGRVIGIGKTRNWDPCKIHIKQLLKSTLMFYDMLLHEHVMQVNGYIVIFDSEGLTWRHVIQLTPSVIHSIISIMLHSTPVRYKAIHIINVGKFVYLFMSAFMPFIPYKIKKRIHFHSSGMESLHKFIDPKYLPIEYGGELPSCDLAECNEKLLEFQEFFVEQEKFWNKSSKNNSSIN
ncbi:alpha-tocopherol transfer protein-like [Centruroides vittatus]|uniref:alpha-tocopherol transfer protein-like n=1 Tax=Centruroides vittatus TaxID=120091 RepID=UPI00350EDBBD